MKRWLFAVVFFLVSATAVEASLPGAIENTIRTWFNSAAKLIGMAFAPSTGPTAFPAGLCPIWMDSATLNLVAKCSDTGQVTVLANSSVLGCVQDADGNLTCNSFASLDQNGLTPRAANRWRVFDNDVDLTPNPSCADYGEAGVMTMLDIDESAVDDWVWCDGTTELGPVVP